MCNELTFWGLTVKWKNKLSIYPAYYLYIHEEGEKKEKDNYFTCPVVLIMTIPVLWNEFISRWYSKFCSLFHIQNIWSQFWESFFVCYINYVLSCQRWCSMTLHILWCSDTAVRYPEVCLMLIWQVVAYALTSSCAAFACGYVIVLALHRYCALFFPATCKFATVDLDFHYFIHRI